MKNKNKPHFDAGKNVEPAKAAPAAAAAPNIDTDMKELENGWTDADYDTICHFEHYPLKDAREAQDQTQATYVVETINWTLADKHTVHRNKYFVFTLPMAIALAAQIEIAAVEVAENVVDIYRADEDEVDAFSEVCDVRDKLRKPSLSKEMAKRYFGRSAVQKES